MHMRYHCLKSKGLGGLKLERTAFERECFVCVYVRVCVCMYVCVYIYIYIYLFFILFYFFFSLQDL